MRFVLAAFLLLVVSPAWGDIRVVDGDTIAVDGEMVRIIGLDAPETHRPQCEAERRLGEAATARLRALVAEGVTMQSHGRDRWHRTLAVVTDRRGRDVADVLIREGLARNYNGRGRREGWC